VLSVLAPIKSSFKGLSYADLIVLAGHVALEDAGAKTLRFCGGRVDASEKEPPLALPPPRTFDNKWVPAAGSIDRRPFTAYVCFMGLG
jgi:catalase (peroxidase I)